MKNWYGILGGQRQQLHQHIHESLVDLADFICPTLTLVDSSRVVLRNGPTRGNLEDVLVKKSLIAGADPVDLYAYVAKAYWNMDAAAMPYKQLQARLTACTRSFAKSGVPRLRSLASFRFPITPSDNVM